MKAIVDALIQTALYSAAMTAGILLFRFIFKKHISPRLQYLMWWLLILRLIIPVTPDIGIHLGLQDIPLKQAVQAAPSNALPSDAAPSYAAPAMPAAPAPAITAQPPYESESAAPAAQPYTASALPQSSAHARSIDGYSAAFIVWLLGAVGFLGWLIFVKLRYYESLQHLMAGGPKEAYEIYQGCCEELCVKPLPLWIVDKSMSPGIAFFGEPVLLIPLSLCGDEGRLRFALLHELTHKKRGDHYMTLLLNILRAAYWFDPVVHLAFSELRADMESACDSDVLAHIGRGQKRGYLTVILEMFSYDTEPILGMSQIRSKRMAKRRMKGAFMKTRTSPLFRAITLCLALIMSLCCFTTACQSAPEKDISSELNEPLSINTDPPDGFSERVAMENLQRTGAIRHLNYFSEPPRGAGGFSTECAGDFDGDGKFDKAYIAGQSIIIELSGEKIEVSAETISEPEFYIGGYFFIEGADLTGHGKNEIVLRVDTGGNGGLGVCNLIVLQNTSSGWKPIDGVPFHGVSVSMTWKDNMCKITSGSYCENVADGYMMQQHYEQAGSGDNWAAVDGVEYSSENAADPPCDIAVIREQNRSKIVITQYITGPTGVHVDQLGYMDTTFAFNDDGSCDIDNKCFVLFPYDAEKPSDARPAAATYAFDRTDPKQAVAEFLTRYLDDMAHGNDDFGFDSSNNTMYDGLLQLQGSFESHKNIALLRQWISFTQVLRETTVPAIDRGRFQSLEITEFGIVDLLSGGIMYEYLLKGYFKTTVMGTFIEAGLIKDGDKYVITYVDFPDDKEYQNFCADFIDYAERNDIKDYNKNAYIEYIRKQKQQAAERYPMTGSAGSGEGWRTAWRIGVRSVPSAAFAPTQFTADIYYGFTIDKFNTTKTSSAAESLVSIDSFSRNNRDHILDIMSGSRGVLPANIDLIQRAIGTVDWGDDGQIYGGVEYDVDQFFGGSVSGERLLRAYSLGTDGGQQVLHTHYYLLQSPEKGGYDRVITFRFLTATTKAPIAAKNGEWTIYLDDSDCERWLKTLRAAQPAREADASAGLTSSAVADIQSALKALGYLENPSGSYDSATRAAIEMFQEDNALPSDGIAGGETLALLLSDSAKNWTLADGIYAGDKRIWREPPKDGVDGWSSIAADKITAYSGSSVTSTGTECKLGTASVNPNAIPIGTELYIPGYGYAIAADVNAYKNKVNHLTKEPLNMIDLWFASKEDARNWENKHNFTILYRGTDAQLAREAPTAGAIVATAKNQVGKEYALNASGPDEFDCSGLVYYVLNECGITVDHKDCAGYAQNEDWSKIESLSDVKAGDILFFRSANSSDIQHAGIAVSSKNMIDASSSYGKVVKRSCNTDYWNRHFAFARRVVE